jgi:hypothetical protein
VVRKSVVSTADRGVLRMSTVSCVSNAWKCALADHISRFFYEYRDGEAPGKVLTGASFIGNPSVTA